MKGEIRSRELSKSQDNCEEMVVKLEDVGKT